jgi:hypothetical protein
MQRQALAPPICGTRMRGRHSTGIRVRQLEGNALARLTDSDRWLWPASGAAIGRPKSAAAIRCPHRARMPRRVAARRGACVRCLRIRPPCQGARAKAARPAVPHPQRQLGPYPSQTLLSMIPKQRRRESRGQNTRGRPLVLCSGSEPLRGPSRGGRPGRTRLTATRLQRLNLKGGHHPIRGCPAKCGSVCSWRRAHSTAHQFYWMYPRH